MANENTGCGRTARILSTYHFFRYCEEVELNTLQKAFSVSAKTAQRDMELLRRAGVLRVRFDKKRIAYVPASFKLEPMAEEKNETRRQYLAKIRRICVFMAELEGCDGSPITLYRSLFPSLTARTRQRDFAALKELGYGLRYMAAFYDEPGQWSVEIPPAFLLDTVPEAVKWW